MRWRGEGGWLVAFWGWRPEMAPGGGTDQAKWVTCDPSEERGQEEEGGRGEAGLFGGAKVWSCQF